MCHLNEALDKERKAEYVRLYGRERQHQGPEVCPLEYPREPDSRRATAREDLAGRK